MSLLFKNYSPVEVTYLFCLDSIRLSYSKETHRILIEMVLINKILTHAHTPNTKILLERVSYYENKRYLLFKYNLLFYQPLPFYHFIGIYRRTLSKTE